MMAKKAAIIKSEVKKEKIWGCDVWTPTLSKHRNLFKFANRTQLTILKVPVRERGLTSSGKQQVCWVNTNELVEVFGGKTIVGWYLTHDERQKNWSFSGHAIWLNKQNRASCVTKSNLDLGHKYMIITEGQKRYILFAVYGIQQEYYDIVANVTLKGSVGSYKIVVDYFSGRLTKVSEEKLNVFFNNQYALDKDASALIKARGKSDFFKNAHFYERSVTTQRTLAEIKAARLAKQSSNKPTLEPA